VTAGQPGGVAAPTTGAAAGAQAGLTSANAGGATASAGSIANQAITADVAANRAVQTSTYAAVDQARLAVAAAQVDAAWDQYFPRLTLTARYTRLSPITPPSLGGGGGFSSVVAQAPGGVPVAPGTPLFTSPPFTFPVILDQWTTQASLLVPLSDYVFRIYQQHEAALQNYEAAKWNAKVTLANAATDARVAFYNVLRARGQVGVAKSAVAQSEAHLRDMRNRFEAKVVTIADVARVEANLAAAQLAQLRAENLVTVTEANLRMMMHASGEEALNITEDLEAEIPPFQGDLPALRTAAFAKRPELKALDAQIVSAEKSTTVAGSQLYPRFDAIGNVTYANPNPRFIPQSQEWNATWDVSLQLSWSPNDALVAHDTKKQASAQVGVLKATRDQIVDGLGLDVVNAYARMREAEGALATTRVELRAAEEAYRVRKEQFALGTTTSALLIDAEADLTRARLNALNARVDVRIARVQLKKATGEMVP
jgi:outer membrane protein TolC